MKKTFVYRNLLALVVVLTLLITASATMLTTHASWGGFYPPGSGWGSTNSWEEQTVVVRFYDENDNVLTTANGAKATFGDSNKTEIDLCTSEHDEDGTWVGSGFSRFYVSNHNVSSSKNGKYLSENGLVVTPPPGYYVETVVLTCDHYHGEGCNTRAEGNLISFGNSSFESADYVITAEQFSEAQSDASLNEAVFHDGAQGGKSIHVTVYLAKCPSPAYIKYDAGNTGLFSYTGTATSGNLTGAARLNQDAYSYSYTQGIEDVPKAEVLAINPDLFKAAAAAGYKFTGWQLQYYTNANASATDVTLSGINGAASLIEATYNTDGTINAITDTVSMHLHAKLTAQWEKVPVYAYTVEYHLENLDGTYTTVRDIDYIAPAGQVIYSSAHLDEYTAPEGYVLNTEKTEVSDVVTSDNNMVLVIYYDRQDYKVTYYVTEPGASSPTKISENTYAFGAPIPSVTPDAVTGYTAYYWYETNTNNTSATKATVPELMPAKDLVYYGFYDANSYTVTYYFNGEPIGDIETYEYGTQVTVRNFPTPPAGKEITATAWGCSNVGAVDGSGNAIVFTPASKFNMPATDLALYVRADKDIIYTVEWILVGLDESEKVLHTDEYLYDAAISHRHLPTHENHPAEVPEGYSAHGWYTDAALTTIATIPNNITTNLKFYAGLDENDYKVYYHLDGTLIDTYTSTYEYGSTVTVAAKPVLDSHTIEGWYLSSDDPGVGNYKTPDHVENSTFIMPANDVYLYAWSDIKLYNVKYYLDGDRLTPDQIGGVKDSYEHGQAVVPATLPTKTGYTVSGWFDKNGNAAVFPTAIESDLDYYAVSEKATFNVQYFIDGVAVSEKIPAEFDSVVTAHDFDAYAGKVAEGYEFLGDTWTLEIVDAKTPGIPEATIKEGTGTFNMPASDVELHAVTKVSKFKVSYFIVSEDGATVTPYGIPAVYDFGHSVTLLPVPATTEQYTYSGWYTTEACTTLNANTFNMPAADVNVYARPTTNKYTVEYHIDGVRYDAYGVTEVPYGTEYTAKAFPTDITGKEILSDAWTVIVKNRAITVPSEVAPNGKITMPASNLILEATTSNKGYKINYYVTKDGVTTLYEGPITAAYEAIVDLAYVPVDPEGLYEYSAWECDYKALDIYDVNTHSGKEFKMPAQDINFYSEATQVASAYEVRYVDIDTGEELKDAKEEIVKIGEEITEIQPGIYEYVDADNDKEETIVIQKDEEHNLIIFYYKEKEYTVTYYFNGDKIGNVESYKKGENVVVRDYPTPPTGKYIEATAWGYDNAAAVDGNGNALVFTPASTFQMPDTNLDLYVASNGNVEYTVTWVLVNGGNSTILHTDKYTYNQPITERHLPTREYHAEVPEGYSAHGWYSDPALATPANIPHHVTTNLTFYAGLDKNDYKVFYHLDGKLFSTKTYEYGSTVTVAAKPVWDSHTIEGWYVSSDDPGVGNYKTPDYAENSKFTMPAKNVYLYAWSDIKLYNVRYYLDGVRLTPEQLNDVRDSYEHGEAVVAAELPTVTGYAVSGWFDKNGNAAVFPTAIESDLDYYATTDKAEFTVQYFIDDKPVSDKITFKYGDKVTADAFGKYTIAEGREFVGDSWTFNLVDPNAESVPTAAVKAGSGTFTMPASDVKLCAVTKNSVYKLNYWVVSEDGTVTQYGKTVNYEYGHEVELLPIPKATHFTFTGWYTTADCTEAHDHVFDMPAKDVNVYANATKNDYIVNYYIIKDGKTEHFSGPYDQNKDDIVTLIHAPVDANGNYEYSAWVADLDSLEYKNSGKEFVMPGSNVNFYSTAKKLTTTYTIVYVDEDTGEEIDRDEKGGKIGETVVEEQPDVPGYEFADEKETKTIVLVEDEDQNVIIFYYEKEVTESEFRVEYKVYNPAYDTGNPDDDHYRYRTLDYYVEVADVGETVTARTRVFPGYTEIPGQNKSIVVSKNNNLIVVLYTDNTYDPTPDYFVQYFFNGVLDDSMTVHGEGNDGDVIKAEDFYLDDPTYTLVDVKPATEITLQIGTIGIINIYYEYEVIPVVPVIPVEPEVPVEPEEPSEPDTPVVPDEPDDKEDEEPFVPQQPDDPTPPNTSDVSYVYGIMAVMAALAAAGVLASKKILR